MGFEGDDFSPVAYRGAEKEGEVAHVGAEIEDGISRPDLFLEIRHDVVMGDSPEQEVGCEGLVARVDVTTESADQAGEREMIAEKNGLAPGIDLDADEALQEGNKMFVGSAQDLFRRGRVAVVEDKDLVGKDRLKFAQDLFQLVAANVGELAFVEDGEADVPIEFVIPVGQHVVLEEGRQKRGAVDGVGGAVVVNPPDEGFPVGIGWGLDRIHGKVGTCRLFGPTS